MTVSVQLFTRPGCHLCEEAEADLAKLQPHQPHVLELVDITSDAALLRDYGERIPVLSVGGREYAAPLSIRTIESALKAVHAG